MTATLNLVNEAQVKAIRQLAKSWAVKVTVSEQLENSTKSKRKKMSGLDQGLADIKAGRITEYKNSDDMFKRLKLV